MKKDTIEWLYNWTKDKDLVTVEELLTAFEKFKEPSNPTKQTAKEMEKDSNKVTWESPIQAGRFKFKNNK
jgi:hypothetical protein